MRLALGRLNRHGSGVRGPPITTPRGIETRPAGVMIQVGGSNAAKHCRGRFWPPSPTFRYRWSSIDIAMRADLFNAVGGHAGGVTSWLADARSSRHRAHSPPSCRDQVRPGHSRRRLTFPAWRFGMGLNLRGKPSNDPLL